MRPLFHEPLDKLSAAFQREPHNIPELEMIRSELSYRQSDGARRLLRQIEEQIALLKASENQMLKSDEATMGAGKSYVSDDVKEWTNEAVAKLRAKLIDLSRKSPLISFKHTARSASQLRIVDERPDLLWRSLESAPMGFEPLPGEDQTPPDELTAQFQIAYERARLIDIEFRTATESLGDNETDARAWQDAERTLRSKVRAELGLPKLSYGNGLDVTAIARAHGFDPSFELKFSDDEGLKEHHEDDRIRVLLTQKELDKRLKTIWDRAGSHLRETGLHTLHLVFGFVQWFEDDTSDIPMLAPLLLMPVALQREVKRGRYEYTLRTQSEELEVNIALIEKARTHWGLQLPGLREDESPESYFIRARAILDKGNRLKLNCFVTLAVLPPMILWKDLDPGSWPEEAFASHRLLPGLLGAKDFHQSGGDDHLIDIEDPVHANKVPALITDADASQHRAIMDMAAGHDMAIEGPPGTGKSQTITNMIATALAKGKRILFVAEKQAALRVVAERLRSAGFGPLLLELHGDRAVRSEVYDSIRERLYHGHRYDEKLLEIQRKDLQRNRETLRRYLSLIRTPLGALELTAHDLAWRQIRLRDLFSREQVSAMEARWWPSEPSEIDHAALTQHRELLEQYGQALKSITSQDNERTRWTLATKLDAFNQRNALEAAGTASAAAMSVADQAGKLERLGLVAPQADADFISFSNGLASLTPFTSHNDQVVLSALKASGSAATLLNVQSQWQRLGTELSQKILNPESVDQVDVTQLAKALEIADCPESVDRCAAERHKLEQLLHALGVAERDLDRLKERLRNEPGAPVRLAREVAEQFVLLGSPSTNTAAILRADLLDPLAMSIANASEREAAELRSERAALLELASSEILRSDPVELDDAAQTLEMTGFLGRLGGSYRAAKRQAHRLLGRETNRLEAAAVLRRAASISRAISEFKQSDKSRPLFPDLLWNGVDSDFASMRDACQILSAASMALSKIDESDILAWWLKLDSTERQRFTASCTRITPLLAEVENSGLALAEFAEVIPTVQARLGSIKELEAAAQCVGLKFDSPLYWSGRSVAEHLSIYIQHQDEFERLCREDGLAWVSGIQSDLSELQTSVEELTAIPNLPGDCDLKALLCKSSSPTDLMRAWVDHSAGFESAVTKWQYAADRFDELVGTKATELAGSADWVSLARKLAALGDDQEGASLAADLLKYRNALVDKGLEEFCEFATEGHVKPEQLADLYELLSISALLQEYLGSDGSELSKLGSLSLDSARKAFRKADRDLHKLEAAAIIAARLKDPIPEGRSYGPRSKFTDLGLIIHEVELTRPRTPLRDVVHRAGSALMAMKPVWMMSPTSAAQFIRPGQHTFDLLIIDEASQMRPEYSLSCMLRADQFVVVGDANQLPPSDHFQMGGSIADDDDGVGVDDNTESILDLANQRFRKKPRLKWHYRSQHESLIQFSNRQFYDRELIVFPSPSANDDDLMGVKCTYVPAKYPNTKYESSINQIEAEEVIEQAFGLMQRYPERSIGIVAMNAKQTELIQNEFDRLTVENEQVRKYVEAFEGTVDEFFIKNLENVQGDERDIILISTVYGPGTDGKVRQNFGLMNREVGWRRLNVLVTRAKMSCRLITSLRPDDIKLTENSSRGVVALKQYLTYAHNGAQYDDATGGETDSDFEIFVADAIRGAGYEVVYQVGVENFRIDLGVRHANCPIGFIAGIECDGAPYHSGLTVRDRDHIRQSVLEGLGWRIYRVWSTDWFADSARETAKLVAWLDAIRDQVSRSMANGDIKVAAQSPAKADTMPRATVDRDVQAKAISVEVEQPSEAINGSVSPREPKGRKLRPLGDIEPYEVIRGTLYELWRAEDLLGEVEVLKRATGIARVYGGELLTSLPEYEGRVAATGESFKSGDLYAAMRWVASKAVKADA